MKRFFALLLTCAMVVGLIPSTYAREQETQSTPLTEEDYVTADLMWEAVNTKEAEMHSKRAPLYNTIEALITEVTSSPYYAEGSLIRNGDHFFWKTTEGIACGYSPRLAEEGRNAVAKEDYDLASADTVLTTSYESKGGNPVGRDVFLFQPYYGIDAEFTEQYVREVNSIASALGGTATTYRTTGATVDAIANAIEEGAVVVFDSHGDTDYAKGEDYVSCANTSYICLQTNSGLTAEDYEVAEGPFGSYYHAYYAGSYGTMRYYCVDGTAIANHMEYDASNSMLWMALCLSMATDGLHAPLLNRGVEVTYGYSQSVTFEYDYRWEEVFWKEMKLGKTVAEAVSTMKAEIGLWDWCHGSNYDTIDEARAMYCAFPIVVSTEDPYPGHGNVDDLQNVQSLWTLTGPCVHTDVSYIPATPVTCTEEGCLPYYLCNDCRAVFKDEGLTERISPEDLILPATGHSYDNGVITTAATCTTDGVKLYSCQICGHSYTEILASLGHSYAEGFCTNCGKEKPQVEEFDVGVSGRFILAAKVNDVYHAMPNNYTDKSGKLTGAVVEVTDGFVEEYLAKDYILELTYIPETGNYTISNGTYFLRYPSSTNLGGSSTPYYWTVSAGVNGTWQLVSQTVTRVLCYRSSGYNTFGGYYKPNVTANGREYYDIEILPVAPGQGAEDGCKHSRTEEIQTLPTCSTDGSVVTRCEDCGLILNSQTLGSTGHIWDDGVVVTEASCVHGGEMKFTCSKCGESRYEELPQLGHSWNEGVVLTEASCSVPGSMLYTCTVCSETRTKIIETDPHVFQEGMCTECGASYTPEYEPFSMGMSGTYVLAANVNGTYYAMYNDFSTGGKLKAKVVTPVNGYVLGSEAEGITVTLEYDELSGTYSISNGTAYLTHDRDTDLGSGETAYGWTLVEKEKGCWQIQSQTEGRSLIYRDGTYEEFGCYASGNVISSGTEYFNPEILPVYTYTPGDDVTSTEPTVDGSIVINHSLNLASDISINYAVRRELLQAYDSFRMVCKIPVYDEDGIYDYDKVVIEPELKDSFYYFTLKGITAVQMGDEILATLHMDKGEEAYCSETDTYSVAEYAYAQLGKEDISPALTKLCAELLRYGSHAQQFKGYRTEALADRDMTEEQRAICTDLETIAFGQNNRVLEDLAAPVVLWAGKTLNLESKVVLRFIVNLSNYEGDPNELVLRVSYKNYEGKNVNVTLYAPELYMEELNYYAFDLDTLLAAELRTVISAAVYNGEAQVSPTVQYSPDSYGNGKTGTLLTLCKALMSYSDTALAYFTQN